MTGIKEKSVESKNNGESEQISALPFVESAMKEKEEYDCDTCEEGAANGCPHAEGRHYDALGEGISPPAYCPNNRGADDDLPF